MRLLLASLCVLALATASPTPANPADDVVSESLVESSSSFPWISCAAGFKKIPWGIFSWTAGGPTKCVPEKYMKISCPVVRALAGSGWLPYNTASTSNQYLTDAEALLDRMTDVLGFEGEDALKPFRGIRTAKHFWKKKASGEKVTQKDDNGNIDLLDMENFLNHAASSGILGSATHAAAAPGVARRLLGKADQTLNPGRLQKLKDQAKTGDFTPAEWGDAVDFFAGERYHNRAASMTDRVDLQWSRNPFSWAILTLEFTNTLAAFKRANSHVVMRIFKRDQDISVPAITDIWQNGHLPSGFIPYKNRGKANKIEIADLVATAASMAVKIPQAVFVTMRDNHEAGLAGPKALTQKMCGGNEWPNCR